MIREMASLASGPKPGRRNEPWMNLSDDSAGIPTVQTSPPLSIQSFGS
jgi:hypothetical protein